MAAPRRSRGPPPASATAPKEGWLWKKSTSGAVKNWKKRWFILEGSILTYKANEYDDRAKGVVEFDQQAAVLTSDNKQGRFCFVLRGGTVRGRRLDLFMASESPDERRDWMTALAEHITNASAAGVAAAAAAAAAEQEAEAEAAAAAAAAKKKRGKKASQAQQAAAARTAQRHWRGFAARRRFRRQRAAAVALQSLHRRAAARALVDQRLRALVRPVRVVVDRVEGLAARHNNGNCVAGVVVSARPLGELESVLTAAASGPAVRGLTAQWGHGGEALLLQGCDRSASLVFTVVDTQSAGAMKSKKRRPALGQATLHLGALPWREHRGRHALPLAAARLEERGTDAGEDCAAAGGGTLHVRVEPVPHFESRCGYLWKRGKGLLRGDGGGAFKRRWVVLIGSTLSYYANYGDAQPAGEMSVADATLVQAGALVAGAGGGGADLQEIEVHTAERVWTFRAEVEAAEDWQLALEVAAGLR